MQTDADAYRVEMHVATLMAMLWVTGVFVVSQCALSLRMNEECIDS